LEGAQSCAGTGTVTTSRPSMPSKSAELQVKTGRPWAKAVAAIIACLLESVVERPDDRVVVAGAANLARYGSAFESSVAPLLELLEEHVVLLRLLGESTSNELMVRIGAENDMLPTSSVVTTGYGAGDLTVAQLGVVGPTHMDYSASMRNVNAVARYVGRLMTER